MGNLSRRELLVSAAATAVATAFPNAPAVAKASTAAVLPAWIVGSEGEFNWQHIVARTQREALLTFACDDCGYDGDDCGHDDYVEACDCCEAIGAYDAERVPQFDGKADVTAADWLRIGSGHLCSRCGYETFREEGGHPVGDEAICSDCMTLADWDIVDPDEAARLRAESLA